MKIQILLPMVLVAGTLAAYVTRNDDTAPSVQPIHVRTAVVQPGNNAISPAANRNPEPSTSAPEAGELRALLEHSLVTGSNARAFMELFARDDSQFQEYIELALAKADHSCKPLAQYSNTANPAQSPTTDSTREP